MARRKEPQQIEPDLPPGRAIPQLESLLGRLQRFKGRTSRDVEQEAMEWTNYAATVISHAFGNPSPNLSHFHHAKWAGQHNMMGISAAQQERNLVARIQAFEALLKSCVAELRLLLPPSELKGAYSAGDEYDFYRDLKNIVSWAQRSVFIIDPYLDENTFDLYVERAAPAVEVRMLTDKASSTLVTVAGKFARRGKFQLRRSSDTHDRHIFVDDRGWVIGQSIKQAAQKKPTYIVELHDPSQLRGIYENIWASSTVTV